MKKLLTSLLCVVMVVCFMPAMAWAATVSPCTDASCGHVAAIEDTHYDTLQEAVGGASDSDTVTLIKNTTESITIETGKNFTLDLNGCTLTGAATGGVAAITNNGTLVIKDTKENGKITRDTSNGNYYVIDNQGTMTVESGEISVKSATEMPLGSSLIRNAGKGNAATLNIMGGKLHQDGFIAVKNDDKGILNVSGGTITTLGDTDTNTASAVQNWGTANITGGEIGNIWVGTWKDEFESKMTISGDAKVTGKIIVKQDDSPGTNYQGTQLPTLEINGGEFNVTWHVAEQNTTVDVAAGTFTNEVPKKYLADNTANYEKIDGKYVVAAKTDEKPTIDPAQGCQWVKDENGNFVEQKIPYIPPTPTTQTPTIESADNATVTLSDYGTKATIKVADGYELVDVTVNGVSKGKVETLTGLKTGDKIVVTTKKIVTVEDEIAAVKATKLVARTEMSKAKGKKAVKVYWYAKDGSELNFDGYEVYRSLKRYEGFGTSPFFKTAKEKYYNTAIKKGTKYYYKVRAYKVIDGEKVYTDWSTKAWRTVK